MLMPETAALQLFVTVIFVTTDAPWSIVDFSSVIATEMSFVGMSTRGGSVKIGGMVMTNVIVGIPVTAGTACAAGRNAAAASAPPPSRAISPRRVDRDEFGPKVISVSLFMRCNTYRHLGRKA
jgi:hypothetical protein